jgi:hypothetical protein
MVRLVLLLLMIGALTIFVVQNAVPAMPLTFLGMKTVGIPLGIWVVGAIAAGALTTFLFSILFNLSGSVAASRARRTAAKGNATQARTGGGGPSWSPPPWTGGWKAAEEPQDSTRASRRTGGDDDWGQGRTEAWDDWGTSSDAYTPPQSTQSSTAYRPYQSTEQSYDAPAQEQRFEQRTYEEPVYEEPAYEERDEWDDWEEPEPEQDRGGRSQPEEPPPKKIVEVNRAPASRSQSGTVYSYTYRPSDEEAPPRKESIYDAEFRVIMPPQEPPPEEPTPPSPATSADEWDDWEEDVNPENRDKPNDPK